MDLRIVNINYRYIDYLKSFPEFMGVQDHKYFLSRNGGRKYVGVVFTKNGLNYYVPVHSGWKEERKRDIVYTDRQGKRRIRKSKFDIYMILRDQKGNESLQTVLKCAYMIPVGDKDVIDYSIENETDPNQKAKFQSLYFWLKIQKNKQDFLNRCEKIYQKKILKLHNQLPPTDELFNAADYWLNYPLLEEKCREWIQQQAH